MSVGLLSCPDVCLETVGSAEGFAKEATEIQNIQIADGDIPRGLGTPLLSHLLLKLNLCCRNPDSHDLPTTLHLPDCWLEDF